MQTSCLALKTMLQLLNSVKFMRLPYKINSTTLNDHLRYFSNKCKKPGDKDKDATDCKKTTPDLTNISGGSKCKPKKTKSTTNKKKQLSCIELLIERDAGGSKNKFKKQSKASSGGSKCPPCPIGQKAKGNIWGKISKFGLLPMIAVLTLIVFSSHHADEHPEFIYYPYMYRRTKPFYFKDGNRSMFHNSEMNALPPDGYEDETDVEAAGKTPETDDERKQREKEFAAVQSDWKKMDAKRESTEKVNAEKEEKRLQEEAENKVTDAKVHNSFFFRFTGSNVDEED